jgi:arginine decarboxylase
MSVSATERFTIDDANEIYGLDGWGDGYLRVGDDGNLLVTPTRDRRHAIDILHVVQEAAKRGVKTPLLLRFPQLLESQVAKLHESFQRAIEEFRYSERYLPVFPVKVNQQKPVVEALLACGRKRGLGLEVGSRPELLVATALDTPADALIVCNGFKDADYLSSAVLATRLGKKVVIVIEKPFELDQYLEVVSGLDVMPLVGFRIKLQARGSGLWDKSGGFASKFGLTTLQLIEALEKLSAAGLKSQGALLHFHIGSQITDIRKIKNAVNEAARIYAKVRRHGIDIRYLDVGGGLGIDYDGSKTSSDASVNYTVQEYANDVVFGIHEVCEDEDVPAPCIVSESGRMLVAYHSLVITDVRGVISAVVPEPPVLTGREPQVVQDLAEVARGISVKNYREYYHDAVEYRDQMYSLFGLGMLDLSDRAKAETLFWQIARAAVRHSKTAKFVVEEFAELETLLHDKYICNFSVFQSLPDHWALDQLFPVIPVHRLNEEPTRMARLVDITCDSDGEVEKFVDLKDIKHALEVHDVRPGEPYYLAFALAGAYQDTMGDLHNLFGSVNEAQVILTPDGKTVIRAVRRGDVARDTMKCYGYEESDLLASLKENLDHRVSRGEVSQEEAASFIEDYRQRLGHYTYLD